MFITLEGIEGSGKTTLIQELAAYLDRCGHKCLLTREPGGTRIGKKIRAVLLDPGNDDLVPMAELLLYLADRAQHVHGHILPALAAGKTVICDRFADATRVYQGVARGLDPALVDRLHRVVVEDLKPDVTLLLDLDPAIGLARAWKQIDAGERAGVETRFEAESLEFHAKIRAGYLQLARMEPERFRIIDAAPAPPQVAASAIREMAAVLGH